jgi:hypothetical protein
MLDDILWEANESGKSTYGHAATSRILEASHDEINVTLRVRGLLSIRGNFLSAGIFLGRHPWIQFSVIG